MEGFWAQVDKSGECWVWTGSRTSFGHGTFYPRDGGPVRINAHRRSWEMHFGAIPEGLFVLHHCDNPPCVRPDHLFLGTQADNMQDALSKGRYDRTLRARGEQNGQARLTADDVRAIRVELSKGRTSYSIAPDFGVNPATIWRIAIGQTWSWLP